jgi:hypothetical protein
MPMLVNLQQRASVLMNIYVLFHSTERLKQ